MKIETGKTIGKSKLATSLVNLAAQVLSGAYRDEEGVLDEERLRSQVMRLYRGVDFEAPEGRAVAVIPSGDDHVAPDPTASWMTTTSWATGTDGAPAVLPDVGLPPEPEPAGPCPERRRHGVMKRRGETCTCGYSGGVN